MSEKLKLPCVIIIVIIAFVLALFILANAIVVLSSKSSLVSNTEDLTDIECIVVLGAGIKSDGTPSDMLADRLDTAILLYRNGVADRIILSGDCSGEDYDEVGAMLEYCLEKGISQEALIRDNKGYSTYESIDNVINGMKYSSIVVVTQEYHLYRALYIADKMDARAYGVSADLRKYRGQINRNVREYAARIKDVIKSEFNN